MKYHINFELEFKPNPYSGRLIAIEGIDGSGKTTQAGKLTAVLSTKTKVFQTHEPTDGRIGKFIRQILAGQTDLSPVSFQYLFSADRQENQIAILKHLKEAETVVTDRYFWSALTYGMSDKNIEDFDKEGAQILIAQSILSMYHQFLVPDLTVYLRIPVDLALERIKQKKEHIEIYEREEKLMTIKKAYDWMAAKFAAEIRIIDGTKTVDEVTDSILKLI